VNVPRDPDDPTRPLPPAEPRRPVLEREAVVTAEPDPWAVEILDRLRSLRFGVTLVGLLAAAALAVALWALLSQDDRDSRRGASAARVSTLEDRVDELEQQAGDAASSDDLASLRDRQRQLDERLSALEDEAGGGNAVEDLQGDVTQLSDSVEQLGQTVEDLDQRVQELEQQSASP
jgi:uncharacterized coiled-coil protein SlyX